MSDKQFPKSKRDNSMKKNKSKVPFSKTNTTHDNNALSGMSTVSSKKSLEEKEKFKQETLENLRSAIRSTIGTIKKSDIAPQYSNGDKSNMPLKNNIPVKSNVQNHYALNDPKKMILPAESDISISAKQTPLSENETELLKRKVAEYLKNFVVFGYDMNGARILITNCKTTQDSDSVLELSKHIPAVLFSLFNGRPPDISDII